MPESSFNITAFARRLGLKNIRELPLIERVQPTVSIGEFAPLTPALVPPAFISGGFQAVVAAQFSAFSVQSLGPGGCFCSILSAVAGFGGAYRVGVLAVDPGLATLITRSPVSNEGPGASIARRGTVAAAVLTDNDALFASGQVIPPLYIPRGSFYYMEAFTVAVAMQAGLFVSDVPASESEPS